MNVILLGRGRFSPYLQKAISKNADFNCFVLPCRSYNIDEIIALLLNKNPDIVIDLLDPSNDYMPNFAQIADRNNLLRDRLKYIIHPFSYVYISSANLYLASSSIIVETSPFETQLQSDYLLLKYQAESYVSSLTKTFSIVRLPTILYDYSADPPCSFFDDLINSRVSNIKLQPREGDDRPFTYINVNIAAKYISSLLDQPSPSHINITNNCWTTRFHLKNNLDFVDSRNIGLRISTNYSSLFNNLRP